MRIAFIIAGAADMYCGSCLRDNLLANELHSLGEDITVVPTYTPVRVDGETLVGKRVFFGAIDVYLQEKFPGLRERGGLVGKLLGSQALLGWISRFALSTNPAELGRLTLSILRGKEGHQRRSLRELVEWLARDVRPDVVHLPNSLLLGFAREIKERLGVPVVCGLSGEDVFLDGLVEPYRSKALELMRERAGDVDRYTATTRYCAERMTEMIGLDAARVDVVLPGVNLEDYTEARGSHESKESRDGLVIGYFARIAPEKGLHLLANAYQRILSSGEFPGVRLRIAGYLGGKERRYAASVRRTLAAHKVVNSVELFGTVDRQEKLAFLRGLDVFSVPTVSPEPKGLFVLEALASGVPVVQPRHGAFPELLEHTGGGLLHEPGDPADLAAKLRELLGSRERRLELGESGREAVHARFSSSRMAEDTLAVYRKVVGNGVS